jgi:hypothetical protein
MEIIRVTANDLYYLPRVKNLEREYNKIESRLLELEDEFDKSLDFETISVYKLNIISAQMQTCASLMSALKQEILRLKLEVCN